VDISHIGLPREHASVAPLRQSLGIGPEALVCLYSGNMGAKQGLEILAQVALLCSQAPEPVAQSLVFVFCGNGAGRDALEKACLGLSQVRFMDLQPLEVLPSLLALADIHLLPQRADAADLVMPSKLTGMLASGRPVIATAHAGTELACVVGGDVTLGPSSSPKPLGMVVPPEVATAMAQAVLQLAADPVLRQAMGAAARAFAETHLDQAAVLVRFEAHLQALVQGRPLQLALVHDDGALHDGRG
jgi:colanic acid biosynthesis glycosyl transferase WcaI